MLQSLCLNGLRSLFTDLEQFLPSNMQRYNLNFRSDYHFNPSETAVI